MSERWMPVRGYEGYYEVSDHGLVRSVDRISPYRTRWGTDAVRLVEGRMLRSVVRGGYIEVGLCRGAGKQRQKKVHRLVLEAFVGPCPEGMECRHLDGDPSNNMLSNLAWGTPSENTYDRIRHGTHSKTRLTHCPQQHLLSGVNLDPSQQRHGRRSCWSCRLARDARRLARRQGRAFDFDSTARMYFELLQKGWRPAIGQRVPR